MEFLRGPWCKTGQGVASGHSCEGPTQPPSHAPLPLSFRDRREGVKGRGNETTKIEEPLLKGKTKHTKKTFSHRLPNSNLRG